MIRTLSISTAFVAALLLTGCPSAQAQFGGVQVQMGRYGTGVRTGNFNYGNSF